jgi:transcription initiation factor TFIIIB Brf1 subunit/transcription initiation factor TFIIB
VTGKKLLDAIVLSNAALMSICQLMTLSNTSPKSPPSHSGLVGKGPTGMAAAALYIASIMNGKTITQRELAKAADVTEVTVRNRYKGLDNALHLGLRSSRY